MTVRYWLSKAAEGKLVTKQEKKYGEMRDIRRLDGIEVGTEGGANYIDFYVDPSDFVSPPPTIGRKFFKKITFVDTYHVGFRKDGIYKYRGATARVVTERRFHGRCYEHETKEEVYQKISISAGSFETLRQIYSKIRSGALEPTENWGASMLDITIAKKKTATAH